MFSDRIADITRFDCIRSVASLCKGELRVSRRYMKWQPTGISIQVIKSTTTILRSLEKPENWPIAAKIVTNSAVLGIRIFEESGLEERLAVKTTVRFLEYPFI